jgi:hypothetical protein
MSPPNVSRTPVRLLLLHPPTHPPHLSIQPLDVVLRQVNQQSHVVLQLRHGHRGAIPALLCHVQVVKVDHQAGALQVGQGRAGGQGQGKATNARAR